MLDGLMGQSADLTTYEAQERNGKEHLILLPTSAYLLIKYAGAKTKLKHLF